MDAASPVAAQLCSRAPLPLTACCADSESPNRGQQIGCPRFGQPWPLLLTACFGATVLTYGGGVMRWHSRQSDSLTTTNTGRVTLSLRYVLVSGSSESPSVSLHLGHRSPAAGRPPAPVSPPISPREAAAPLRPSLPPPCRPAADCLHLSGRRPPIDGQYRRCSRRSRRSPASSTPGTRGLKS